ncbi:MAG: acetoacetate--CoA ligase [Deltaproteobacteria bacterium]|nr:acetoacetate--CoA ligase [Deltaproteobacteria bacterium]MBI3018028.1 acetoacetate--CoA ligase [Deltaproteobacteria bacterium]
MTKPLWTPSQERIQKSNFTKYFYFLKNHYHLEFDSYEKLYQWSIQDISTFWESIWKFCDVKASTKYEKIMGAPKMPGTEWFRGAKLNFAQNLLRYRDDHVALISVGEDRPSKSLTYKELTLSVAQCAQSLKKLGVKKGDRVAGFIPNISEGVVAMLATSSLGAIWSSCSPDFGVKGVLDRFGQIQPKVLFTADGYSYNGKKFDSLEKVCQVAQEISSIQKIVVIEYVNRAPQLESLSQALLWNDFLSLDAKEISFEQLPFDHPLYILYSSGTTGVPKCIVHGQGGTLLQHLKELVLHTDLKREDRICYITTCGWMMWNWLVSSLAVGATIVLTEGSATYPTAAFRWKLIEQEKLTILGTSPKFISLCQNANIIPQKVAELASLKTLLSTGSPLSKDNFEWVYKNVKKDLQLSSISGGTDIISCFMLGNSLLAVYPEEIQCRGLGMKVEAFNDAGKSIVGQKGELVCTAPFPSMPIYFWDDPEQKKYLSAYFQRYPNIWHHGDYVEITARGGLIVYGRSDATLNPGGVRIGTAEIYRQMESLPEIKDSIVVGQQWQNDVRVILFVVLHGSYQLTEELITKIKKTIKEGASPRHVPAKILTVTDIPYTISGKKVELAVTRIIHNEPIKNKDALANPGSLEQFKNRSELQS